MIYDFLFRLVTVLSTTVTVTDFILTPQGFEDACRIPVAVLNAAIFIALLAINSILMFAFWNHHSPRYNPNYLNVKVRERLRIKRLKR